MIVIYVKTALIIFTFSDYQSQNYIIYGSNNTIMRILLGNIINSNIMSGVVLRGWCDNHTPLKFF